MTDALTAAAGVLVAETADDELVVVLSSVWKDVVVTAKSLEDLLAEGLLTRAVDPGRDHLRGWAAGWPDEREDTLLVALESALFLPAALSRQERRIACARFIGSCPPPLAKVLRDVLRGMTRLLALTPSHDFSPSPPADARDPHLLGPGGSWQRIALDAPTGPLAPARWVRSRLVAGQHIAIAEVLPSLGALDAPTMTGTGIRADEESAKLVAIAEAHERHAAGSIDSGSLVVAALSDRDDAVAPDRFVAFADWQLDKHRDLAPFSPDERRLWVRCQAADGSSKLVLADLIFYPFGTGEAQRHVGATSSGVAAHRTPQAARAAAWEELLERDAFMRHWLARTPGRRLAGVPRSAELDGMSEDLRSAGWTVHMVQLGTTPSVAAFCAVAERDGNLVLGASVGDPAQACCAALRESWAGVRLPREREVVPEPDEVRSPSDHRRLYRWGNYAAEARFLWETDETVEVDGIAPVKIAPDDALFYDWPVALTRPFAVSRALSPQVVPITFGFEREPLGRADVRAMLLERECDGVGMMPHPFP
ncbi:YcaO-like family protein [Solirubrobacter sp. CPCC 204708]|uniref:YcaO-like family protein n=1 Tax=Solirubrobacter deserti TaxID=2282478 RepID=A0ABT4RNG7_9ACTN|nr:YcaO-like family protein [Solirubrobacter deserti]MBE2318365.1 YcaO-like family protein [Solirubrobacter deserti]MDA0140115.1 YcaO-like family protein [Solirubrobacter deserti]